MVHMYLYKQKNCPVVTTRYMYIDLLRLPINYCMVGNFQGRKLSHFSLFLSHP